MPVTLKGKYVDFLIILLLFPILIVDMVNGILFANDIAIPLSISQCYKMGIIVLCGVRMLKSKESLKILFFILSGLLLGTFYKYITGKISISFVFQDIIKASKYLIVLISFLYFRTVFSINRVNMMPYYILWIKVSYFILAFNLFGKLVGLGYPMYPNGAIGTKGFFIAGNEISALLLILSGILGYYYWEVKADKVKFVLYGVLSFSMGLLISSKTGMLGILLINALIVFNVSKVDLSNTKQLRKLAYTFLSLIAGLLLLGVFVVNSPIMYRYTYFWDKLDIWTFIFSSRNLYFKEMLLLYQEEYTVIDKIIGVGHTLYESMAGKTIEIDILDILFGYGYVGVMLFLCILIALFFYTIRLKRNPGYPFARLSYIMLAVLTLLSCLSGHIFNSGIAGIYIGFVFSMMFFSKSKWERK